MGGGLASGEQAPREGCGKGERERGGGGENEIHTCRYHAIKNF